MIEKKFLKAIKDFGLISKNDRILVAFSGGVDSAVLVELLLKLKERLKISDISLAHLNHSLRGKESDEDEKFCINFAQERGLVIYTKKVDVKKLAKENKMSVEEAARSVRYSFLKKILKEKNYTKLATGHHLSDLVETMILWFIQGNRKGIKGFKPREDIIIRPMYYIKKDEISGYAERNQIPYRVDLTNFKTDILRNRIRHNIIPQLRSINPSLEKSMLTESLLLQMDDDYLNAESKRFSQLFLTEKIKLSEIKNIPQALLYRLFTEWIYRITGIYPSYTKILNILYILNKKGEKKLNLGKGYILIKSYDYLFIQAQGKKKEIFYKIKVGDQIFIKEAGIVLKSYLTDKVDKRRLKDEKNFVCFDIREEKPEFIIRSRKEGDRFLPFGRKTEKKLKDLFIEMKIPRHMRDTIPLLEFRNKILWVIGYKRSGHYPIDEKTEKMICFEIKEV